MLNKELLRKTIDKLQTNPPKSFGVFKDGNSCCAIGWMAECAQVPAEKLIITMDEEFYYKVTGRSDDHVSWDPVIEYLEKCIAEDVPLEIVTTTNPY